MHLATARGQAGRAARAATAVALGAALAAAAGGPASAAPARPAAPAGQTPAVRSAGARESAADSLAGSARAQATAAPAPVPNAAAMYAASGHAAATGKPVQVPAATTELSTTTANPNGSYTMTTSLLPVRVRVHGRWVAVSARLHRAADGKVVPAAVPSPVVLSDGGTGPLVRLTSLAGGRVSIEFPVALRTPVVSGATATYQSAVPGVSLQVTVSSLGGVTETIIAAARTVAVLRLLRHLALSYATSGLALSADQAGNLAAAGPHGESEFSGPASVVTGAAAGPRNGLNATVRDRISAGHITLPLGSALAAPGRAYPLRVTSVITPDITSAPAVRATPATTGHAAAASLNDPIEASQNGFVETQNGTASDGNSCTTLKNWNVKTDTSGNAIATNAWGYCEGLDQAYYRFDTSALTASMHVTRATLNIWENYSANLGACSTSYPINLYDLGDTDTVVDSGTTEQNEPSLTSSEEVGSDTIGLGPNPDSSNNCPQRNPQYDVTSDMQTVAQYGDINYWNYGLQSGDKSSSDAFARFGYYPDIMTIFDLTPPAPTYQDPTPAPAAYPGGPTSRGCSGAVPWIGATPSVRLNADFEPASGLAASENVYPEWKWSNYDTSGSSGVSPLAANNVSPGSYGLSIPTLTDGETYTYQAATRVNFDKLDNGSGYTTWGPDCSFNLDLTPPATPAVTSTTFPPSGSTAASPVQGASGTFGFASTDPAPSSCTAVLPAGSGHCLASGVYEFVYSLNQPLPANRPATQGCSGSGPAVAISATTSGGTATATSCAIKPANWGTNILYVEAVDTAGNVSQSYEYDFYVTWNEAALVTAGDVDGDGIPDLLATTTSGSLLLYPGHQDPALAPVTASTAADSPQPGTGWNQFLITHRGSWTPSQEVDDLFALKGANLYRYIQNTQTGGAPQFEDVPNARLMNFPGCPAAGTPGADPDDSANCTGYPTSWSGVSQILAPGDAWTGATSGTGTANDTGYPSLLAVDSANGSLWLFQGDSDGQFQDPIQLGSSGWNSMTVIAPGPVGGQNTLWARDNSTGDLYSYPFIVDPVSDIPTLNPAHPGTPVPAEGAGTTAVQIPGITLPQVSYPSITSPGPLTGGACSTAGSVSCPGLYAEGSTGSVWYYPGQPTTGGSPPLTGSDLLVGKLTGVQEIS